jgi:hypothetical protein
VNASEGAVRMHFTPGRKLANDLDLDAIVE